MKLHYSNTNNPVDFPKMNERLKQLAEQAEDWADKQNFYESDYRDYLMEKFAELIVEKCVSTLEFHGFEDAVPYIKWMAANKLGVKP
jgi:hypothetical protein